MLARLRKSRCAHVRFTSSVSRTIFKPQFEMYGLYISRTAPISFSFRIPETEQQKWPLYVPLNEQKEELPELEPNVTTQ